MKYTSTQKPQYSSLFKRLMLWTLVFAVAITLFFTYSKTAHAGLLSFVNSILGSEEASAKIDIPASTANSQTIALLQAAVNPDPNPNKSFEMMPVDKNALVADISALESLPPEEVNTQISVYTVREGDTLSNIADMFDVTVSTIIWANDISSTSDIQPGDTLVILPVTGITYTVQRGDTIKGITASYKADLEEVLQYNGLSLSSTLIAGQKIILPDAEIATAIPTKVVAPGTNPAHDTNGPTYAGYYKRPVIGGVKSQHLHGYNGVDIADSLGTPIYAAAAGTVILSKSGGYNGGYGNYIIISHPNDTQTLYAHNTTNLVSVGQKVEQGDQIATMGMTGKATGSHVHFEIRGAKNPF